MAIRKIDKSEIDFSKIYGNSASALSQDNNTVKVNEKYWGDNSDLYFDEETGLVTENGTGLGFINKDDLISINKAESSSTDAKSTPYEPPYVTDKKAKETASPYEPPYVTDKKAKVTATPYEPPYVTDKEPKASPTPYTPTYESKTNLNSGPTIIDFNDEPTIITFDNDTQTETNDEPTIISFDNGENDDGGTNKYSDLKKELEKYHEDYDNLFSEDSNEASSISSINKFDTVSNNSVSDNNLNVTNEYTPEDFDLGYEDSNILAAKAKNMGFTNEQVRIAIGISRHETGNYKHLAYGYNYGGVTGKGDLGSEGGYAKYSSKDKGMDAYLKNLKENYFDMGLNSIESMARKYLGYDNTSNWINKVGISRPSLEKIDIQKSSE